MKDFIPKHKLDDEAVEVLQHTPWEEVLPYAAGLLEWLQDMHWPVAGDVAKVLGTHTDDLQDELIVILQSNDGIWKYSCLQFLINNNPKAYIGDALLAEIKRLAETPTDGDRAEEADLMAKEILESLSDHNII